MSKVLAGLAPQMVFDYFEEICGIPHGSDNIQKISDYLVAFAQKNGLWYVQEPCGNVIMKKPATPGYEDVPTVILQGHMDMVAVKDADCAKDMLTEGLDLFVDGDLIGAKGTSLGGDDGIALAYAMAILASDDIPHPALEFVATINEETGMDGASALDASVLAGRQMLNIDSEEEGVLLTGCAGGLTARLLLPKNTESCIGKAYCVRISGLQGGHSGTEIDKNRANAILLLGRVLRALDGEFGLSIISVQGGTKDNVIPGEAEAVICLNDVQEPIAGQTIERLSAELCNAFAAKEPNLKLNFSMVNEGTYQVYDRTTTNAMLNLLMTLPFGVAAMSGELPGLVETSNNVGILREEQDAILVACSIRSLITSEKMALFRKIEAIGKLCGAMVRRNSEYPGWQYRSESPLRDRFVRCYKAQYGEEPVVQTIHAGLECGLFIEKMPDLDAVSFGPNIYDIHTTKERLSIESAERTWRLLLAILGEK